MKQKHTAYQLVPFPKAQQILAAAMRSTAHKHMIHVLTEVDVTVPRQVIHEQKARGAEPLSFTAFIAACLGKAIDEDTSVQAYRKGKNQLVLFEDVDIYIMVEREVEGHKFPLPCIVRAANHKTAWEIHQEIRSFQNLHSTEAPSMPPWLERGFARWPSVLMPLFGWMAGRSPRLWKSSVGTCGITAVGMFGKGLGWGIPSPTPHSLFLTLGGISEKSGVVDGHIALRDYLSLTISFDHDIIDGAPAARFTQRFKDLIEGGYGLEDSILESKLTAAEATAQKR